MKIWIADIQNLVRGSKYNGIGSVIKHTIRGLRIWAMFIFTGRDVCLLVQWYQE